MFHHCMAKVKDLFENGSYQEALEIDFASNHDDFVTQMIVIVVALIAVITLSVVLMCRFMKEKNHKTGKMARRMYESGSSYSYGSS